ncbi:MAG: helix-turn-helix domain-containing protein [Prevotellaceae bacterium]|jgi:transcriptional regulator with XRE-family HTH domain|nr:helix-turn-helix domain-containing protein [Prevotellaceae bacterium]
MKNLNIHIGEIISDVMKSESITKAELARKLDVKPQSIDYLLKRKSIDTHALYRISGALNYDFAKFFSIETKQTNCDNKIFDFEPKKAKILLEVELNTEDIIKLNLKDRVMQILNK